MMSAFNEAMLDLFLVLLVDLADLILHELVIGGLAILSVRLDLLELGLQVGPLDLVLRAAVVAALPLTDVDGCKGDTEDDQGRQIHREVKEVTGVTINDFRAFSGARASDLHDRDVIGHVESQPDKHEVGAEDLVVSL